MNLLQFQQFLSEGLEESFAAVKDAENARVRSEQVDTKSSEYQLLRAKMHFNYARHHNDLANFYARQGDTEKALHHSSIAKNHRTRYHTYIKGT